MLEMHVLVNKKQVKDRKHRDNIGTKLVSVLQIVEFWFSIFVHNGELCVRNLLEGDMAEEFHLHEKCNSCTIKV